MKTFTDQSWTDNRKEFVESKAENFIDFLTWCVVHKFMDINDSLDQNFILAKELAVKKWCDNKIQQY